LAAFHACAAPTTSGFVGAETLFQTPDVDATAVDYDTLIEAAAGKMPKSPTYIARVIE
jgi:hypothetical protein